MSEALLPGGAALPASGWHSTRLAAPPGADPELRRAWPRLGRAVTLHSQVAR